MARTERMEDQLAYLIASVNRQLQIELEEKLRPTGIPIEQFRILAAITSQNGQSMGELAAQALVDSTTLTKIIDRMVMEILVYRGFDPKDRRKVLVFLAPKGAALHDQISRLVGDQQRMIISRLQATKAKALENLLRDLMA